MLNPGEIGGIAGGAAVLVAGGSIVGIGRRSRRINRALADPDSATRLAALDLLTERGLSRHLGVLVERALVEDDPPVRAALVGVLEHAEWEPGSDRRLLQLRTWAGRCAAESAREGSNLTSQGSVSEEIKQELHPVTDEGVTSEGEPATNEQQPDHPVSTAMDRWFSELLAGDEFEATDTEIDFLPTVSIAHNEDTNGGRPQGVSSGFKETIPIAKAEQNAIKILREAGYRVATTSEATQSGTADVDTVEGIESSLEAGDLQLLTELCVRRVITATILEEATRRMRAENSRLEALLARFNELR